MQNQGISANPIFGADHVVILNEDSIVKAGYTVADIANLTASGFIVNKDFIIVRKKSDVIKELLNES